MSSIGVVLQGPLFSVTPAVVKWFVRRGHLLCVSTWDDESEEILDAIRVEAGFGKIIIIQSERPSETGINNHYLQRRSTIAGIQALERSVGFVLKWRTDVLPLKLNIPKLIKKATNNPPSHFNGRLVVSSFRSYPISPDFLSTLPDMFMFGTIDHVKFFWANLENEEVTNAHTPFRSPVTVIDKDFEKYMHNVHMEIFNIYKLRLNRKFGIRISNSNDVFDKFFRFCSDREILFLWFDKSHNLRRINQNGIPESLFSNNVDRSLYSYDISIWYCPSTWMKFRAFLFRRLFQKLLISLFHFGVIRYLNARGRI